MSIVFRLAGHPEYNKATLRSYASDVDEHFNAFRDHEVIRLAKRLRKTRGVSYDAVMNYAVHLDAKLQPRIEWSPRPDTLDSRWREQEAEEFLTKLQAFAREADFTAFFAEHKAFHQTAVARLKEVADEHGNFGWFDEFFGAKPGASFTAVLGLLNGGNSYGARFQPADGSEDLYCVLGVWETDWRGRPKFDRRILATVAHEFCHSYVNPEVYAHEKELRGAGQQLYKRVAEEMQQQAYGSWLTMMHESLVRAAVVRYVLATQGKKAAAQNTDYQVKRHFVWMPELVELLADYEANREMYPSFETFLPQVVEFFDDYASHLDKRMEVKRAAAPKVISLIPSNGANDVDPDLAAIVVTFDRPMAGGYSFVGGGPHYPETTGKPVYSSDRKTITLGVNLKPNWDYHFWLNRGEYNSFQSADGTPLKPVHVKFRTGP